MCGKYTLSFSPAFFSRGSPPRVREILRTVFGSAKKGGITPACAGNTCNCGIVYGAPEDHPRVCGKYPVSFEPYFVITGSPPRVREIRNGTWARVDATGITPACAGNTFYRPPHARYDGDHPRVCGKYPITFSNQLTMLGSPPRVREILSPSAVTSTLSGITPACAGNTRACWHYTRARVGITPACAGNTPMVHYNT